MVREINLLEAWLAALSGFSLATFICVLLVSARQSRIVTKLWDKFQIYIR